MWWWLVRPEVDSSESLGYTEMEEGCSRWNKIGLITAAKRDTGRGREGERDNYVYDEKGGG